MNLQNSAFQIIENKKKWVFFLKVLVYILMMIAYKLVPDFSIILKSNADLYGIYQAILFLLSGNILISLGRIVTARFYLRKSRDQRVDGNFLLGINWISIILNSFLFVIALMLALRINPLEFLTSLTIVAAAIAILTKEYVTNMINGLIIMFTDQFSLGDVITVGGERGTITDITLLNVVVVKTAGDKVIIPNNLLLTSQVINQSRGNLRQIEFDLELSHHTKRTIRSIKKELELAINNQNSGNKDSELLKLDIQLISVHKEFSILRIILKSPKAQEEANQIKLQEAIIDMVYANG